MADPIIPATPPEEASNPWHEKVFAFIARDLAQFIVKFATSGTAGYFLAKVGLPIAPESVPATQVFLSGAIFFGLDQAHDWLKKKLGWKWL